MISLPNTGRIILSVCFMAALAFVSLIPGHPKPGDSAFVWLVANTPTLVQKLSHVCLYGVLALLWVWSLESIQPKSYRFLISFFIAVTFGAVLEWGQTKVPGRFGTVIDVALDAAGASLGLLVAVFLI